MTNFINIKQISKEVFELPDGSIAFTMKKASKEYKKIKPVKYTTIDLILFLLYAQNKTIRRRIVLFKELFVLEKAVFKNESIENCRFVPYHYGPYSFYVSNKLDNLIFSGLIKKKLIPNTTIEEFSIEPKGEKLIKKKYENLSPKIKNDMERMRKGLDQYSKHIQEYVYRIPDYKKYTDKSLVRHKYKLITWGRSKE